MILLHDANHKNSESESRLDAAPEIRPAEMVGSCARKCCRTTPVKNCPYCLKDEKGLSEHPDPCLGGFRWFNFFLPRHGQERRERVHVIRDTSARRAAERNPHALRAGTRGCVVADRRPALDCTMRL